MCLCAFVSVAARGFETEEQFETYVRNDPLSGKLLAAVVFDHPFTHDDEPLPLQVKTTTTTTITFFTHSGWCTVLASEY